MTTLIYLSGRLSLAFVVYSLVVNLKASRGSLETQTMISGLWTIVDILIFLPSQLAHNQPEQLMRQVTLLDRPKDIYLLHLGT